MKRRFLGKYDGKKEGWFRQFKELIIIFILIVLAFHFVIGASFVKGTSMNPTLQDKKLVFYLRIVPEYKRGDIISVRMPSGEYYVKRVVAVAGDEVDIHDGKFYLNGVEQDEPYTMGVTETQGTTVTYPYVVEVGRVFVMGDNRENSMDSRTFGTVIRSQIKGKLLFY